MPIMFRPKLIAVAPAGTGGVVKVSWVQTLFVGKYRILSVQYVHVPDAVR